MKRPWARTSIFDVWNWPQIFWLSHLGWWAEELPSESVRSWVFRKVRALLMTCQCIYIATLTTGIACNMSRGEADSLGFFALTTGSMGAFELAELIRHRGKLKTAMNLLDDLIREALPQIDGKLETKIRGIYCRCWLVSIFLFAHGITTMGSWAIVPLIQTARLGKKFLIASNWPLPYDNWWQYSISYTFQAFTIVNYGLALFMYGSIYFSICEGIVINFIILEKCFRDIRQMKAKQRAEWILICIDRHRKILKVCHLLRDSSNGVIIMTTALISMAICFALYAVMIGENSEVMLNLVGSGVFLVYLMFLYCWYSTKVINHSENVATSLYMSCWEDWTNAEKRNNIVIAAIAQKPLIFGGVVEINLSTFITVLKATFAYYNFIDTVHK